MKRFFCEKCGAIKRVQRWPCKINFSPDIPPANITDRQGECNFHKNLTLSNLVSNRRDAMLLGSR